MANEEIHGLRGRDTASGTGGISTFQADDGFLQKPSPIGLGFGIVHRWSIFCRLCGVNFGVTCILAEWETAQHVERSLRAKKMAEPAGMIPGVDGVEAQALERF